MINKKIVDPFSSQDGYVLVIALMILCILSLLGIASLNTTDTELQIAGNDRQEKQIFYGAESGCMRGGQWLRNLQMEVIDDYVDADLKASYPNDGKVRDVNATEESNIGELNYPVKFIYNITDMEDCRPIPGNDPNTLNCYFEVECSSESFNGGSRTVIITVAKPTDFN